MARYSSVVLPYSQYNSSVYGAGDNPDLRLRYLDVLPTDSSRSHLDASGNSVYGRVTLFWDTYSQTAASVKILRSKHGPAVSHNDPFCTVVASTRASFPITSALRYGDGFTVVTTESPHLLKVGDSVAVSGNSVANGSWKVTSVLNPAQFAFANTTKSSATASGGTATVTSGRYVLPQSASGEKHFTDESVIPGVEYHYSVFLEDPTPGVTEWSYGGSATIRPPKDFGSFQRLVGLLPPYLTNKQFDLAGIPTVDTLTDTDESLSPSTPASMVKVLAGLGYVWDDIRTDLQTASRPWEPSLIPDAALNAALETVGLGNPVSLSNRSIRQLLENAYAVNEFRGSKRGITLLAECLTGVTAEVGTGYNLMPSVDDAEFRSGTGHWVATPSSVDNSTSSSRGLGVSTPPLSGGDTVSDAVFISPESAAGGDSATTASACLTFTPGAASNPGVSLGFGVAVSSVTPYSSSGVYTIETKFPHGLEPGDSVTMSSVFAPSNTSSYPAMTVIAVGSPTTVSTQLDSGITSGDYSSYFGSSSLWNILSAVPGRRNPFAISNGVAVSPGSPYTFSFEGAYSTSASSIAPTTSAYYYDAAGNYLGRSVLSSSYQYESTLAYGESGLPYQPVAASTLSNTSFTKTSISFTTPDRAQYVALYAQVPANSSLTYYLRRFMVISGGTSYTYQSPNLLSVNLTVGPSATTWGASRTNLILDPGFEGSGSLTVPSVNSGATDTSLHRTGSRSWRTTISGGSKSITQVVIASGSPASVTASSHGFVVGQRVVISGNSTAGINGSFVVNSVTNSNVFTVNGMTAAAGTYATGGTAVGYGDNVLGSLSTTLPAVGTYTASAYFIGGNSSAVGTSVRLTPYGYSDGYSVYEYSPSLVTDAVQNPPATPIPYSDGPQGTGTTTSSDWLTSKEEWYDQQSAAFWTLPDNSDRSNNVLGFAAGVHFLRNSLGGNAGRVGVSAGKEYRAGAFVRSPAAAVPIGVEFRWYDSAGNYLDTTRQESTRLLLPSSSSRDYTWVSHVATPTSKVNTVIGTITAGSSSGTTRTMTTASGHGLIVGEKVSISTGDANYDGTYSVATVVSPTSFTYTGGGSTSSSASLFSNPTFTVSRSVAAATTGIYVPRITDDLCGKTLYITCPSLCVSSDPEVISFQSTGSITSSEWSRAYVTFRVTSNSDLSPRIAARSMGTYPVSQAVYNTDSWILEGGDLLLGYFDGTSSGTPYYAGWSGAANNSASVTNTSLPTSAVTDASNAHILAAVEFLKSELPNYVPIGIPYRVTLNGMVGSVSAASIDPTFSQTAQPNVY